MRLSKKYLIAFCIFLIGSGVLLLPGPASSVDSGKVQVIQLNDDTINPVTAQYIVEAIDRAHRENARCLIITIDTPGGLLNSTRLIVKKMLTSKVPIVVYIAPSGSRAGSAGVFITYASHVAAMAPSTNIGAAHPVQMGESSPDRSGRWDELKKLIDELKDAKKSAPQEPAETGQEIQDSEKNPPPVQDQELKADDSPMASKILQDTVAFIKAIAVQRNRNVEWAVQSVVKSASITSQEALEKGVIEIIAVNYESLLDQLDGKVVAVNGIEMTLRTKGASLEYIEMDPRQKFFNVLANPNIAYILMILGFYGLLFEVTHPGFGAPGILGVIFLILAFYSMQMLPTNYAGVALLAMGVVLLIVEALTPTFGLLTLGGLACMVLGSMLLFDSADPIMDISKSVIIAASLTTAAITLFLMRSVICAHRAKIRGGVEGLEGQTGEAYTGFAPGGKGKVFIHGELWNASSADLLKKGDAVVVQGVEGLTLTVGKKS